MNKIIITTDLGPSIMSSLMRIQHLNMCSKRKSNAKNKHQDYTIPLKTTCSCGVSRLGRKGNGRLAWRECQHNPKEVKQYKEKRGRPHRHPRSCSRSSSRHISLLLVPLEADIDSPSDSVGCVRCTDRNRDGTHNKEKACVATMTGSC